MIKFNVDDTSICFINVHLTAGSGKSNYLGRVNNLNTIHELGF